MKREWKNKVFVATIFAWTGALKKRGELDNIPELVAFADKMEKACVKTVEDGKMTKSLSLISTCENPVILNSLDFIKAIRETFDAMEFHRRKYLWSDTIFFQREDVCMGKGTDLF